MTDAAEQAADRLYPLSPRWMTTLFYLILFAWTAGLFYLATDWSFQNKLFPLGFTALVMLLVVAVLLLLHAPDLADLVVPDTPETGAGGTLMEEATSGSGERTGREREYHELNVIGWVISLPLLFYVIGFLPTLPLYTFAFIWYYRKDGRTAVVASALVTAIVYGLFVIVLGVRLPNGVLF